MRFSNKYMGTSSHSDELTGDFGNEPEAISIGDHGLSRLLAEKLSPHDLGLLQHNLPSSDQNYLSRPTMARRHPAAFSYRFSHRRAKPSRPCGRKMIIAMKMNPSGIK
jgi:hypothetical protein